METAVMLLATFVAATVAVTVVVYNHIIQGKNGVKRSWADVITYSRQKLQVLPKLEEGIREYRDFEKGVHTNIAQLRTAIQGLSQDVIDAKQLKEAEMLSQKVMTGLKATFEAYPTLKSGDLYLSWMKTLEEIEENIAAAITIFNRNVELFNTSIQVFPSNLINNCFNHETPVSTFTDSAGEKDITYRPNI